MKKGLGFRLLGIMIFILVILMTIFIGGGDRAFSAFIDLPSLIIVTLIPTAMSIFAGLGTDYKRAFSIALGNNEYTLKEYRSSSIAIGLMIKLLYLSGFFGTLVGFVQMLRFLDDPYSFGPGLAVAVLTLFYSIFINMIQHAIKAKIDKEIVYREH